MHGGMISEAASYGLMGLLICISALIASLVAAFKFIPTGQRRGFFMAAFAASVAVSVAFEWALLASPIFPISSESPGGGIALILLVFGPLPVSVGSTLLVLRRFNRH